MVTPRRTYIFALAAKFPLPFINLNEFSWPGQLTFSHDNVPSDHSRNQSSQVTTAGCLKKYPSVKLFYTVCKMFQTVRNVTHSDHVNVYTQFCRETTFFTNICKCKISLP